jgi:RimJ/RimL family protein N-acetyltransferase
VTVTFRRAAERDVAFLTSLATDEAVEPFLSGRAARDEQSIRAEIEQSDREREAFGRFVIEVDGEPAGMMGFTRIHEKARIARLAGLAIHPDFRGRRLADEAARLFQRHLLLEAGFHRLELEIYAFNERAIGHAERAGFVREGVRRQAYLRHGEWNDAVLFSLLQEDLDVA